jgi:hypothetical protein
VVNLDPAFGEQLLDVAVGEPVRTYHRTATTITSAGNRNPVNAERGRDQGRERAADVTDQLCLTIGSANATVSLRVRF